MNLRILSTIALSTISMQAISQGSPYWVGTDGEYVRSGFGECVRTIDWTPETAIPGCEDGMTENKPAVTSSATTKQADDTQTTTSPVNDVAAVSADVADSAVEPQYRNLSLASGATFELGGSALSSEGKAAVAALLAEFDGEVIKAVIVEGYTDDRGAASFNQQLSEKRAHAVKDELIANGIDADLIKTVGYGESNPVADNATREGRAKNRRVEIKVDAKRRQI